jgi:hypothetical protein
MFGASYVVFFLTKGTALQPAVQNTFISISGSVAECSEVNPTTSVDPFLVIHF